MIVVRLLIQGRRLLAQVVRSTVCVHLVVAVAECVACFLAVIALETSDYSGFDIGAKLTVPVVVGLVCVRALKPGDEVSVSVVAEGHDATVLAMLRGTM